MPVDRSNVRKFLDLLMDGEQLDETVNGTGESADGFVLYLEQHHPVLEAITSINGVPVEVVCLGPIQAHDRPELP